MWLGALSRSRLVRGPARRAGWGHITKILAALALFSTLLIGPAITGGCGGAVLAQVGCCKVCKKGKACGNSCIAEWKDCHKGKGCACDG